MRTGGCGLKRLIKTDYLARVEGEGGVVIEIEDGRVSKVHMRIFEAPRFFESFLRGRSCQDVIDFTARICGICPVAYQMSSVHAIEKIFNVRVSPGVRSLRRLMYCGEWIVSHAIHVYLLQGPDFYGLDSAWSGKEYIGTAKRGLRLKKLGNDILTILGGRPVHPVTVRPGGFFDTPGEKELSALLPSLETGYEESLMALRWAASLDFGEDNTDTEFVSLSGADEYPMNEGRIVSTGGIDASFEEFIALIHEKQVEYSTALHSSIRRAGIRSDETDTPYLVGPLARLNLNHESLPSEIKGAMNDSGIHPPIGNISMSIIARAVELAYAFHEAIRIIKKYEQPETAYEEFTPVAGSAVWATEAPRGMLIHRYELDEKGSVKEATIIPPTSQNLAHMEREIRISSERHVDKDSQFIRRKTEKLIRSYDPCISCSVHAVNITTGQEI